MTKQIHSWFRYHGGEKKTCIRALLYKNTTENSLVVQWLELSAFTVRSAGWISGKGIFRKPHVTAKKMKKGEDKRKQVTTERQDDGCSWKEGFVIREG